MPIDYSRYPPDWLKGRRPRIMARANNLCEQCGLEHGATVFSIKLTVKDDAGRYKARCIWFSSMRDAVRENTDWREVRPVKVVLTIAHLDHDEDNHEVLDDRLKALCQICHLRYDAAEKWRRISSKNTQL
ncbi:hypothetical protein DYBT9623_04459 [Dyadobacter sp. CECT 9623]|uniref:HNH endonuclease n=1 Tax=Dyadobacter linearis TaxID=2823330 RepID=A0ABN7RCG9_9BACT|nr:hypothetical protein [Dyadobacter sp. CECT 9623]CAG5072922.1 hypothetical protein DYBT9623_04459 [Dyadobacter sp. CECT 9623]